MTVYLDLVFLLNFGFDFVLLVVVSVILKRRSKLRRIFGGALVGSLSILFLFMNLNSVTLFLFKVVVSILMVLLSFGYRDFKYFGNNMLYLYMASILLGGFLYYLNNTFAYRVEGLVFVYDGLSINYLVLVVSSPIILYLYVRNSRNLRNNYNNYYDCKVYFDEDNYVEVRALLDTGNKIRDPYSNKGVILLSKKLVPRVEKPILIPFQTLNDSSILKCIKGFSLEIDGKVNDRFLIGVSDREFFMDGIDCIISEVIMEGLK